MKRLFAAFLLILPLIASCSKANPMIKPSAANTAYDTLGMIEVSEPAKYNLLVRIFTLNLLKYRSYDRIKANLDADLTLKAKTHYKAESVINVTYWPDSELAKTTDLYHARGEMIRYSPFGGDANSEPSQPLPAN